MVTMVPNRLKLDEIVQTTRIALLHSCEMIVDGSAR